MISLEHLVAEAADAEIQRDLFMVLADHLALGMGMRPGVVVVLDMLDDPDAMLELVLERCGYSTN